MIWNSSPENIRRAADAIRRGGLVAMPTETVYGLAANALDEMAVASIFVAKGRPSDNPLIVHIADVADLERYACPNDWAYALARRFWPGPLTMILPKKDVVPAIVTAGLDSVAIRLPSHPIAQALIRESGCPIAAPSANLSGKPSGTTAQHVADDFKDNITGVLDGGHCSCGVESTVVSLLGERPILLRPGFITAEQLREVLPTLTIARAVEEELKKDEAILSPGLAHRHYAPKADAVGVIGSARAAAEYIESQEETGPIAVMCFDGEEPCFRGDYVFSYGKRGCPEEQAERLFDVLRALDTKEVEKIYVIAEHDTSGVGLAVYNRLLRSCGFHMIQV